MTPAPQRKETPVTFRRAKQTHTEMTSWCKGELLRELSTPFSRKQKQKFFVLFSNLMKEFRRKSLLTSHAEHRRRLSSNGRSAAGPLAPGSGTPPPRLPGPPG